jgi:hypothetical protein
MKAYENHDTGEIDYYIDKDKNGATVLSTQVKNLTYADEPPLTTSIPR